MSLPSSSPESLLLDATYQALCVDLLSDHADRRLDGFYHAVTTPSFGQAIISSYMTTGKDPETDADEFHSQRLTEGSAVVDIQFGTSQTGIIMPAN